MNEGKFNYSVLNLTKLKRLVNNAVRDLICVQIRKNAKRSSLESQGHRINSFTPFYDTE